MKEGEQRQVESDDLSALYGWNLFNLSSHNPEKEEVIPQSEDQTNEEDEAVLNELLTASSVVEEKKAVVAPTPPKAGDEDLESWLDSVI